MNNETTNIHKATVLTTAPQQLGGSKQDGNATTTLQSPTAKLTESTSFVAPNCPDTPRRNTSNDSDTHTDTYNEPTLIIEDLIQLSQPSLSPLPTLSTPPPIHSRHYSPLHPITSPFLFELLSTPARIADRIDNYITRTRNSITPFLPSKLTQNPNYRHDTINSILSHFMIY